MKLLSDAVAAATGLALMALVAPAAAQGPPADLVNPRIEIDYAAPSNPAFAPIQERLKGRKVLETLRQFLAPVQLKDGQKLVIKFDQCDAPYARYKRQGLAVVCYEFVEQVERLAPTAPVELIQTLYGPRLKPDAALVGPVVQALIHEVSIALFDLLEIPVWGRTDDAADRVAAFVLLQFSKDGLAWNTIVGTAWFLAGSALAPPDFSDVRGVTAQRYYTTLCIAYGGDPGRFARFVAAQRPYDPSPAAGDLPAARAAGCAEEYTTLRSAFTSAVGPHLDQALLRRVQNVKWIEFID